MSGLEQASLFGLQLGVVAFAFIVMIVMVAGASAGMTWCLMKLRYWLEVEQRRMRREVKQNVKSLALSDHDLERMSR